MSAAMPPQRSGSVRRKETKHGTSYGLRIRWRGQRMYHHLGGSWEGWSEERAEQELAYVTAQVERGEYVPPRPPAAPPPSGESVPTFQVFASIVLARQERRVGEKTYRDLEWRLRTAVDHFGPYRLDEIDSRLVDEFVDAMLRERAAIEEAATAGTPMTETYRDARGNRTYERRRRGLSNGSINKVLASVRRVLKEAVRAKLVDYNPLDDRDCFLRERRPSRSFLEVGQSLFLFEAARAIERDQQGLRWEDVHAIRASSESAVRLGERYGVSDTLIRKIRRGEVWTRRSERRRNDVPRLPLIATLVLSGMRVSELCSLDGRHMDFARRTIQVPRVKTDAGERSIPMLPVLYELLLEHRTEFDYGPRDPVFATRNGSRNRPDNVRSRILTPVYTRANELLAVERLAPIGHLTPHTLRRTFASLLAEVGVSPRRAMYLLGHTDPKFTMRVYQQVLDMGGRGPDQLEQLLGCAVDEATAILSGRDVWAPIGHRRQEPRSQMAESPGPER
jgi:integrase